MQTKLAAVLAAQSSGEQLNVSAVCRELGISRKHYYELRRRWLAEGLDGLTGRSRRPLCSPGQVPAAVEDEIVRLRKTLAEQGWDAGARSIRYRMQQAHTGSTAVSGAVPAVSTIHRVLRRRGLIVDEPAKRPRSADRRFRYPDPNACWQIDGSEWRLADGTKVCIMTVIDDHSRALMALQAGAGAESLEHAWAAVSAAMDVHGVPVRVLSDRGGALNGHPQRQTQFRARLRRRGVLPISSRGYHPQTCGKNERSHRTMHTWLRAHPAAASVTDLQTLLDTFAESYNTLRPHQGLDGDTPASVYQARAKVAPSGIVLDTDPVVTHPKVSSRGEIRISPWNVQIGRRWAGCTVTAIREDLNLTVLTDTEVIRKLVINPDHRYQGNGRPYPRSSKPHPRRLLPKS